MLILCEKLGAVLSPDLLWDWMERGGGFPGGRGGLLNSLIPFMGFLHTRWLVSAVPWHSQGTCHHRRSGQPCKPHGWTRSATAGPQAPGSGAVRGQGGSPAPPQALHLKEISWDHQKPTTLIAGVPSPVSFDELLQVFPVISQGPGCWSLCTIVSPVLFLHHMAFGNDPK